MSKESIAAVRQAEDQATVLCRVAEERAAEMRTTVHAEGAALCEAAKAEAAAEYAAGIAAIKERAAAVLEKKKIEAEAEATAMVAAARLNMSRATKLIIWGIIEQCR